MDNTLREKIRTGENNTIKPLDYNQVNRSVESSNFDSKNLGNLNKYRRGAFGNKNNSQLSMPQNRYEFDSRKSSISNQPLMIIEDQTAVSTTVALNKKFDFKVSDLIKQSNAKLKSKQRYKNNNKSKRASIARNHNLSMISPETQKIDSNDQKMRRFQEVNSSVEDHLQKYKYMIPDLQKKKFDLLKQILGEKSMEEIQSKLQRYKQVKGDRSKNKSMADCPDQLSGDAKNSKPPKAIKNGHSHQNSESPKYEVHKGKLTESYQNLGGLGSNVGDSKWQKVNSRRVNMLNFSNKVNSNNRRNLESISPNRSIDGTQIGGGLSRSNNSMHKNLNTLRERREKALEFAKSIKKPKLRVNDQEGFADERFQEFDNNQYLLESQKIKMFL